MTTLEREFEKVKFNIKFNNYVFIMKHLKQFFMDYELSTNGLLIKEEDALKMAQEVFSFVKKAGVLDELNTVRSNNG